MSGDNAFEEEMNSGVTAFAEAMRTELREPLDPRVEADLVRRVAAEARVANAGGPTRARTRFALPARIAFVTGALLLGAAGLAVAGVKLPGPVGSVFETAGVDLPNQATDDSTEPNPPGADNGAAGQNNGKHKAKGHYKGKAQGEAKGHAKQPGVPNGNAYGQGGGAPGNSENAPGQTKPKSSSSRGQGRLKVHPSHPPRPASSEAFHSKGNG
jgi:hypothetical protein